MCILKHAPSYGGTYDLSHHQTPSSTLIEPRHVGHSRRSPASRGFDQRGTPGACIRRGCDRFPPTAEGSIQPDEIEQFVTLETGEVQFRLEQVAFRIEHLQVGIEAPKKTLIGEYSPGLLCPNQQFLLHTLLPDFVVANQSI